MAETNYNDILCLAIDTIVQLRISNLTFDLTIICTIVDDTDAKNGHYIVTDKSVRFDAYSENTEYVTDDDVYVTIPKGDYNLTKVIISKYTADNNLDPLVYIKPLDLMFIITDDLVQKGQPNVISASILANGRKVSENGKTTTPGRTKIIWEYLLNESNNTDIKNNAIFDTLGIRASFKCDLLSTYNVRQGHYGLAITLYSDMNPESGTGSVTENTVLFDSTEMFGNPYSFVTFFEQQKIIDISKLNNITKISIALYLSGDFQYTEFLEAKDMKVLPSTYVNSEGVTEDLMNNIFVSNVEIYFGMNIANVSDNTFSIYCSDHSTFSMVKELTDENYNVKTIFPIWFNKEPDTNKYIGYSDGVYRTYVDADNPHRIVGALYLEDDYRAQKDYYDKGASLNQLALEELGIPPVLQVLLIYAYAQDTVKLMTKLYNLLNNNLKNICDKLLRDVSAYQTDEQKNNSNTAYLLLFSNSQTYATVLSGLSEILDENNANSFMTTVTDILKEYGQVYLDLAQWSDLSQPYGENGYMYRINNVYSLATSLINDLPTYVDDYFRSIRDNIPDSIAAIYDAWNNMQKTILQDCLDVDNLIKDLIGSWQSNQIEAPSISYEFKDLNTLFQQGGVLSYAESKEIFELKYQNRYCIYWYKYVENYYDANERYMPSGWQRLLGYENIGLPKDWEPGNDGNDYWVAKSNERVTVKIGDPTVETELILAILIYNHEIFKSNILTFKNEEQVIDENTKSAVTGLWIALTDQTDEQPDTYCSKETYQLYGMTNMLINSAERYQRRKLRARFTGLDQDDNYLKNNCTVYWYIPIHSTMLDCNRDELIQAGFSFYDPNVDTLPSAPYGNNYVEGYYMVYRLIAADTDANFLASTEVFYLIKNYFMPTATNNTIRCRVVKNRQYVYDAELFFTFASYGSNGTDYTLCIFPSTNQAAVKLDLQLPLSIGVYDYNNDFMEKESQNILLSILNGFSYNSEGVKTDQSAYFITTGRDTEAFIGQAFKPGYGILKGTATITIDKFSDAEDSERDESITDNLDSTDDSNLKYKQRNRTITLESYFAIPWASDDYYIEGPSFVIYNSMGSSPQYYSDPIKLFSMKTNKEIEGIVWKTEYYTNHNLSSGEADYSNKVTTLVSNYLPKIKEIVTEVDGTQRREYRLSVPSMFLSGNDYYCSLVAFNALNERLWVQPIYMLLNRFDSPMLNAWDGELTIDEKNGTIMSAMVGSGKKNSDNTFSGVLMGEVGGKTLLGNTTGEGLFGFDHGEQSFGFKTDGTSFIGKAKRGRIEFNGNSGTIASASYNQERDDNLRVGMKIDLDDGEIDMRGAYIADAVDLADSQAENIINAQYTHNNEQDGYNNEVRYNPTGSRVMISTKSPFLVIKSPSVWYTNEKRVTVDDFGNKQLEVDPNTTLRKAYDDFWNSIDYYKSDEAIKNLLNNYWDINDNLYPRTNNAIRTADDIEDMDPGVYAPVLRTILSSALLNKGYSNANIDDLEMFTLQKAMLSQGFIGIAIDGDDPAMQKGDYLYRYTEASELGKDHWKYIPSSEVTEAMINSSGTVCLARYNGYKITNLNNLCGLSMVDASGWVSPRSGGADLTFNNINDTMTLVEAIRNSNEDEEYLIKLKFLKDEDFLRFRAIANIGDDIASITGFVPPANADSVMYKQSDGPIESVSYEFGVKPSTTLLQVGTSSYFMQSEGFTEGSDPYKRDAQGLRFDLSAQKLIAYGGFKLFAQDAKTFNNIEIGSTGTFLHVKYNVNPIEGDIPDYVSLLKVTTNEFLIQSKDWNKAEKTGTQFDVGKGMFTSYNFNLHAEEGRDSSKYQGSYVKLSSRGNPFFLIHYKEHEIPVEELTSGAEDVIVYDTDLMHISSNKFILQSKDWRSPRTVADLAPGENYNVVQEYAKGRGLQFDIANGKLTAYNKFKLIAYDSDISNLADNTAGSYVELSSTGAPYLQVYYQHNNGEEPDPDVSQILLRISKRDFYLNSLDWHYDAVDPSQGSGMHIDLANANIIAYKFHLYAFNNTQRYAGSYVKLSSEGTTSNPFLQVHFTDYGEGNDPAVNSNLTPIRNLDIVNITKDNFIIQSHNWSTTNGTGLKFDLTNGQLLGYNFQLLARRTSNPAGTVTISSADGTYPIRVTNGSDKTFAVKWDGSLEANAASIEGAVTATSGSFTNGTFTNVTIQSGTIAGWRINGNRIDASNGTIYLDSSTGTISGAKVNGATISGGTMSITGSGEGSGTFGVSNNGVLSATGANITGAITATSGTFTGTVNANQGTFNNVDIQSGTIAGWNINSTTLSKGDVILNSSNGQISGAAIVGGTISGTTVSAESLKFTLWNGATSELKLFGIYSIPNFKWKTTVGGSTVFRPTGSISVSVTPGWSVIAGYGAIAVRDSLPNGNVIGYINTQDIISSITLGASGSATFTGDLITLSTTREAVGDRWQIAGLVHVSDLSNGSLQESVLLTQSVFG